MTDLYRVFRDALDNLDTGRHIFCGLTANVDIILHFEGDQFAALQREYGEDAILPAGGGPPPALTKTPADVLRYAAWFIARGQGGEGDIASLATVQPLIDRLPQYRAVGGTGIQAANWLAKAGFVNTELYLPQNDAAFDGLVHPGIRSHDNNAGYRELFGDDGVFSEVHCIVDYAEGARVLAKGGEKIAPASDRVIFSGDKANAKLRVSPSFMAAAARPRSSSALLVTGWNGPRTLADFNLFVEDCRELMREYRRGNPGGFIHIEDCYQWKESNERRRITAERVWPLADSLAMNEVEYGILTEFFGLGGKDIPANLFEMAKLHGLRRVCMHTARLSRTVSTYPWEKECRALGLATLFSTARAYYGGFVGLDRIARMVEESRGLAEKAASPRHDRVDDRYEYMELPTLYGIPVKSSIGLGDAFSAGQVAYL